MPEVRKKVLIADDDRGIVKVLATELAAEGYEVLVADDGCRALAQALRQKPDLLILDIHMPFGSGFNVQEHIYKLSRFDAVPIIYISGDSSPEARSTAKHFGAYALITKPFDSAELMSTVRRAMNRTIAA